MRQAVSRTADLVALYRAIETSRPAATRLFEDPFAFSYTAMLAELWPKLPRLPHVLVIGDDVPPGMPSFREFLDSPWEDRYSATDLAALRPDPNRVATLMFTSGTEANPKGVSVVGRTKDMIIRGGANISAREIEELLFSHRSARTGSGPSAWSSARPSP